MLNFNLQKVVIVIAIIAANIPVSGNQKMYSLATKCMHLFLHNYNLIWSGGHEIAANRNTASARML